MGSPSPLIRGAGVGGRAEASLLWSSRQKSDLRSVFASAEVLIRDFKTGLSQTRLCSFLCGKDKITVFYFEKQTSDVVSGRFRASLFLAALIY